MTWTLYRHPTASRQLVQQQLWWWQSRCFGGNVLVNEQDVFATEWLVFGPTIRP